MQVNADFGKIEQLLKLISTPSVLLGDVFKTNYPDRQSKDLIVAMGLKGMRRGEMTAILEAMGIAQAGGGGGGGIDTDQLKMKMTSVFKANTNSS